MFSAFRLTVPPVLLLVPLLLPAQGSVAGTVRDAATGRPLQGVTLSIAGAGIAASTGAEGGYRLTGVAAGIWVVEARLIGYLPVARTDVAVSNGRVATVDLALQPAPVQLADLVTRPSYFPADAAGGQTVGFAAEEIRRAAGAAGDVSRIVQTLPSVARVNDQSNGLIVRGGSPAENLVMVDGIEVPNLNHFPVQGSSSGGVSIIDVGLIEDVEFTAGGAGARVGDRLSSVLDIRLREGNRERFEGQFDLDFMGMGGTAEGPLGAGGSWIVSGRRSWLDLLVGSFELGTTVAPRFDHLQLRLSRDLGDSGHRLRGLLLTAGDRLDSDLETARANAMLSFGSQDLRQLTAGLTWDARWSDAAVSQTSVSWGRQRFDELHRDMASGGELLQSQAARESVVRVRHSTTVRAGPGALSFGGDLALARSRHDGVYAPRIGPGGEEIPGLVVTGETSRNRIGGFGELEVAIAPPLVAVVGARVDRRLSDHGITTLSPRGALRWQVSGGTSLRLAGGLYHQEQPLVLIRQSETNAALPPSRALHVVAGVDHLLRDDTRLTVEWYHKSYDRLATDPGLPGMLPADEHYSDYGFHTAHPALRADGRARATGVEVTLRRKLTDRFYGIVGGSLSRVTYRAEDGVWRPRVFDNRGLLTAEFGWQGRSPWAFSARWVVAGGTPYTPLDETASREQGRTILDFSRINAERMPVYHSLSLRGDRRFEIGGTTLNAYLSVWNAYDRKNISQYYWNPVTEKVDGIRQWGLLPIFGLEWEF